ncbi:hypothetical protein V6N12_069929 [Hibiscus sabdariffa]|uniref:Uncharacterized protein n=1 Tax=Hibiscus sabdariffa TaxID=183260 RepID=A0ABR2FFI3_9ROSI
MMESVNKDAIGGASVAVLGQKLGNSNLSPVEGFDVVVGSSEEEIPPRLWDQPVTMKLLSWNIRGLGMPRIVYHFRAMLRDLCPSVIFLIETKFQASKMEHIRKKCGFLNGLDISSDRRSGGLSIGWKNDVSISVRSFSVHHIDFLVSEDNGSTQWRLTSFCGAPTVQDRVHAWSLMRRLNDSPGIPWCVIVGT